MLIQTYVFYQSNREEDLIVPFKSKTKTKRFRFLFVFRQQTSIRKTCFSSDMVFI